ncbi:MAG: M28 family peptidase [Gemmatimonadales bacterium]
MRLLLLCLVTTLASCTEPPPQKEFDGAQAYQYVEQQMAFGNRIPGTEAHRRTGDWLDSLLRRKADTVVVQAWNHVASDGDTLQLRNFIARFNPAATTRILYLAHWDTRPTADRDSTTDHSKPVPGANDGASGVAVLLGVADALRKQPPAIGVDLLFVDGEDYGTFPDTDVLIGSKYYAAHQLPGPKPQFAVLWDMVGDRNLEIFEEGYSNIAAPEVVDRVWSTAHALGYQQFFFAEPKYTLEDDHVPLQKVGIPAIDVIDFDYPYWHTPDDTADKLSAESLKVVGDVAVAVIRGMK